MDIKLSIIFTVYNSHEVVRRQIKFFKSLDLPDDIEIIIMDDGSRPPLEFPDHGVKNLFIYPTGITIPWSQALARNLSIEKARGDMLLMTDIDHFFPRETIMACRDFEGDKMMFKRQFAILDEDGKFVQDKATLVSYGMKKAYVKRGFAWRKHVNSFAIRKSAYQRVGGYKEKHWTNRSRRSGDGSFFSRYERCAAKGTLKPVVISNKIYTFPFTAENSMGLFHNLKRVDVPIKEDK